MPAVVLGKRKRQSAPELIPGTVTAVTPTVTVQTDGATTSINVRVGHGYTPVIGDRVGLIKWGSQYLALSVG